MKFNKCYSLIFFLPGFYLYASGDDVYIYKDKNGHTVVGNVVHDNSHKLDLPGLDIYARPMSKSDVYAAKYTAAVRPYIPKAEMKINDEVYFTPKQNATRKEILNEELLKEENARANTAKLLETNKSLQDKGSIDYENRIKTLEDAITEHQKNIDILKKELN